MIDLYQSKEESFESICQELLAISLRLYELLPDPSLSPDERLERLARVVPDSLLICGNHKTARSKLNQLRYRLAELVPTDELTSIEKINFLVDLVENRVTNNSRFFEKLEIIGDQRPTDCGR